MKIKIGDKIKFEKLRTSGTKKVKAEGTIKEIKKSPFGNDVLLKDIKLLEDVTIRI